MSCSEGTSNLFTFTNILSSTYTYSSSTYLTLIFANVVNPNSVYSITGLTITTYESVIVVGGSTDYVVDTYSDTTTTFYTTTS